MPLISICIPAYKRIGYLQRLLESIFIQTFQDFEVIVTDDSPNDEVKVLCEQFQNKLPIRYYKNAIPLGTPENWNEAIRKARGKWIKLMHDDDWFSDKDSLSHFAELAKDSNTDFIFSAYCNHHLTLGREKNEFAGYLGRFALYQNPLSLLSRNIVGPPSVTLYRKGNDLGYDKSLQWLVDIDFYIRYLKNSKWRYIKKPLVKIGIHENQVTRTSHLNPSIEIPEHLRVVQKFGESSFRNILFFDAFWRLIRNLNIKTAGQVQEYAGGLPIASSIYLMVAHQQRYPRLLLLWGPASKILMLACFISNYLRFR